VFRTAFSQARSNSPIWTRGCTSLSMHHAGMVHIHGQHLHETPRFMQTDDQHDQWHSEGQMLGLSHKQQNQARHMLFGGTPRGCVAAAAITCCTGATWAPGWIAYATWAPGWTAYCVLVCSFAPLLFRPFALLLFFGAAAGWRRGALCSSARGIENPAVEQRSRSSATCSHRALVGKRTTHTEMAGSRTHLSAVRATEVCVETDGTTTRDSIRVPGRASCHNGAHGRYCTKLYLAIAAVDVRWSTSRNEHSFRFRLLHN
jgi:hypothetical protein